MLQSRDQIGKMDHRVYFQEKVTEVDASNADAERGWQDVANPGWWCTWNANPGNEVMQAEQLVGVQIIALEGRTREVNLQWRIHRDEKYYDIISVQEISRRYIRVLMKTGQHYVEQST